MRQNGNDVELANGDKLGSKVYLLERRAPRKIIVSGDNDDPSLLAEFANPVNVLIHEATYTEDLPEMLGEGPQHSSAKMLTQFATELSIFNLVLTHFSSRYQEVGEGGLSIKDIESEARAFYNGNLFLANDLDVFHLDRDENWSGRSDSILDIIKERGIKC